MKPVHPLILSTLAAAFAGGFALRLQATTPEEAAVLAPIQATFDAMAAHDAAAIKASWVPGATLLPVHDGKATRLTLDEFATRISGMGTTPIQERIHDPVIHVDGDLAMVWAPYEFLREGKVEHCGTDLFNLARIDGKWLIADIAWTTRRDCPK